MARILLIDDEPLVRLAVAGMLEAGGHTVIEAENGVQGIGACGESLPDLVITDLVMPQKEGLETIVELRKAFPTLRIIAMSGGVRTGGEDLLQFAARLGASHVLAKPFRKQALLDAVTAALAE